MESERRPGINEQHGAYRRGLVLGLTMAEVGILIIFVLLLLIALGVLREQELRKEQGTKTLIDKGRLTELEKAQSSLAAVTRALGVSSKTDPQDIERLVAAVQEAVASKEGEQALVAARNALKGLQDAQATLEAIAAAAGQDGAKSLGEALKDQSEQLGTKEGQLKFYEAQFKRLGKGDGGRPCWVEADGSIDYLYEVVLRDDGIQMREIDIPSKAEQRATLPMPTANPSEVLSEHTFLSRTEALFRYGQDNKNQCRFYVKVYDGTGDTQKGLYKSHMKAVEGHFYKLEMTSAAPF